MHRDEVTALKRRNPIDKVMKDHGHLPQEAEGDHLTYKSPFGADTDGSLPVDLDKAPRGLFFDAGLGRGGDVITLVTLLRNCSPGEAIELLKQGDR